MINKKEIYRKYRYIVKNDKNIKIEDLNKFLECILDCDDEKIKKWGRERINACYNFLIRRRFECGQIKHKKI